MKMNKAQRIRAIFENNVSKMLSPEQQAYEDWKLKQHQEKTKSGETAAGIRRGQHVTPGNKADQVYGGRDHMGYLRVSPAQLKGQRLRMSLQHHVDRLKGSNPELADRYRNLGAKRGMQLASTDHFRAGLRALFESVLDEANEDEAFGPVDPNDPKSFGEKPLKQPPKIKFKPKPANMPKGPIAVTKKPFQRDPLDP